MKLDNHVFVRTDEVADAGLHCERGAGHVMSLSACDWSRAGHVDFITGFEWTVRPPILRFLASTILLYCNSKSQSPAVRQL